MSAPYLRKEVIGSCELYLGDCLEVLPTLGPCHMLMTSPPYEHQRDYGRPIDDWRSLVSGAALAANYADDAQVLINLGLVYRDGECVQYWDGLTSDMRAASWRLFGWYVWDKGFGQPVGDLNRLLGAHEWVFHFNKAAKKPLKWVRTTDRNDARGGVRQKDGSVKEDKFERRNPFKVPDSVIRIFPHQSRGGPENAHPAVYPVALPSHLIQTYANAGECVLDPFMGSGTTGVAALKLGRKFMGIEIDEGYFNIACERIRKAYAQPDFFVATPQSAPVQEALL